jgi:hypothetical protein
VHAPTVAPQIQNIKWGSTARSQGCQISKLQLYFHR